MLDQRHSSSPRTDAPVGAAEVPLYRQLYQRIARTILDGRLRPGDRLPSARAYAAESGVARGTVDAAYGMLAGNGLIETRPRVGTIVAQRCTTCTDTRDEGLSATASAPPVQSWRPDAPLPLTPGVPSIDLFPRTIWAQAIGRAARAISSADMLYPDAAGLLLLRKAIAQHLGVSRGIACTPEQIVITGGFQSGLALIMRVLTSPGDAVWLEDPGYPISRAVARQAGLNEVLVPVDGEGLSVDEGQRLDPCATLAIITASHQYPLGIPMSLARRGALLDWARTGGAWIVEDDFDGEFRNDGRSLPSLKAIDDDERVLYAGTFSKSLFPGIRLGYIVAPRNIADRLRRALRITEGGRSIVDQAAVADLLSSGQFARHIQRMRTAYSARREAMRRALVAALPGTSRIECTSNGLHLLVRLSKGQSSFVGFDPLQSKGLGTLALARLTDRDDLSDILMVGFANVPERRARALACQLASAVTVAASD